MLHEIGQRARHVCRECPSKCRNYSRRRRRRGSVEGTLDVRDRLPRAILAELKEISRKLDAPRASE